MGFCDICNLYPPEQEVQFQEPMDAPKEEEKNEIQIMGGIYEGEILNKEPNGFGKFVNENGGIHEGYWKNGVPHGFGKVTY